MSEAAKLEAKQFENLIHSDESTRERVKKTHTAELVIGICSQIGAKKINILDALKNELSEFGYLIKTLKLSDLINSFEDQVEHIDNEPNKTPGYNNYIKKIKKGNLLRKKFGNDFLINLAISEIAESKRNKFGISDESDFSKINSQRVCYIIDSIKHKEELETLREVYGDIFYLISLFTPKKERITNISIPNLTENEAIDLIKNDEFQEFKKNGQQVREVFVDADFFIKVDTKSTNKVKSKIKRFVDLIFENNVITPSVEERAMFEAKSASVNSACLSRQVGASIISKDGELLSIGWNDVPKFGGNLYSHESKDDNRCHTIGKCFNDGNKLQIRKLIKDSFKEQLSKNKIENKDEIVGILNQVLLESSIQTLIEFSRAVHAEMHAILNAGAKNGFKLKKSTLFCTTYPCHNCVRHIIAAGITKLIYIEPYIKSKGIDLHNDAITDDTIIENNNTEKVQILMFEGISPKKYVSFFNKDRKRKDKATGKVSCKNNSKKDLIPINSISLQALLYREIQASERIKDKQKLISNEQEGH